MVRHFNSELLETPKELFEVKKAYFFAVKYIKPVETVKLLKVFHELLNDLLTLVQEFCQFC